ncbi:MAG: hypothetical protein WC249_00470 [Patescibacteria group bacterium]|jgi:hypothetical protein
MPKRYKINSLPRLVKDESSTKFHVANNDYFGTIATVLSLLKQQITKNDTENYDLLQKTFLNLENDFLFLQNNYQINNRTQSRPKTKNKNNKPNGKLNNQ